MARRAGWDADVHTAVACRQALVYALWCVRRRLRCRAGRHEQADTITAIVSEGPQRPSRSIPLLPSGLFERRKVLSNLRPIMRASSSTRRAVPRPWRRRRRSAEPRRGKAPLCPRGNANSSRARLAGHFFSTHRATKQDMVAPLGLHSRRLLQQILALTLQLIILPARMGYTVTEVSHGIGNQ
jgi:hypothetical protein